MKIAICEDNLPDARQLCDQLEQSMDAQQIEADLCVYETAEALLDAAKKIYFSVFFLDILLPGEKNGMDAAIKLRRAGNEAPIVFTTVTADYLAQSYSVWAAHYLVKPIAQADVDEALSRAMRVLSREDRTLDIMVARHTERIPYGDIYYIQGNDRKCVIHTRTGVFEPYASVRDLIKRLDDSRFMLCHRSYLINLDHVLAVQRDKVAVRGDVLIPTRRGEAEKVRHAWEDRQFAQVKERD